MGSGFFDWNLASEPACSQTPDASVAQKSPTLNEFQKMGLDMISNDVVRFDDSACFAIDQAPWATDLRAQPSAQRAKMLPKPFAVAMRSANTLEFGKKLIGQIGAPPLFLPAAPVPGFFANDFVHV